MFSVMFGGSVRVKERYLPLTRLAASGISFLATKVQCCLASTQLYCLVTEAYVSRVAVQNEMAESIVQPCNCKFTTCHTVM